MADESRQPAWHQRLRRSFRQIGGVRMLATFGIVLVALLSARFSWDDRIPFSGDAERALYDLRFIQSAKRVTHSGSGASIAWA